MTDDLKAVLRGTYALHQLDLAGRNDAPEADAVRDGMERPYHALDEAERERAGWFSEALNAVEDVAGEDARRWYEADGSSVLLDTPEEVVRRRVAAAVELQKLRDFRETALAIYAEFGPRALQHIRDGYPGNRDHMEALVLGLAALCEGDTP